MVLLKCGVRSPIHHLIGTILTFNMFSTYYSQVTQFIITNSLWQPNMERLRSHLFLFNTVCKFCDICQKAICQNVPFPKMYYPLDFLLFSDELNLQI